MTFLGIMLRERKVTFLENNDFTYGAHSTEAQATQHLHDPLSAQHHGRINRINRSSETPSRIERNIVSGFAWTRELRLSIS